MTAILEAQGLRKIYRGGDGNPIEVLSGVDLTVSRGEFVAIVRGQRLREEHAAPPAGSSGRAVRRDGAPGWPGVQR